MLAQLFAYELRALWKPAAVLLAVMAGAGIVGSLCFGAASAFGSGGGAAGGSTAASVALTWQVSTVLFLGALFCGFLVWAAVVALYVFVVMRFYRTMFTDEGYLTLTLPVRAGTLVMAKFWAAYLLVALFALAAALIAGFMAAAASGSGEAVGSVFSLMGGWFSLAADGEAASTAFGLANVLIGSAYNLGLAFASLTLGAWWARRHKVAAAVGVYLGASWVLSFLFSAASVLVMVGDTSIWEATLAAVSVLQLAINVVVAAGSLALAAFLVRAKVDLN